MDCYFRQSWVDKRLSFVGYKVFKHAFFIHSLLFLFFHFWSNELNEKSNDKRLSAPAPFLICSTTCVWSLKSGGYGGEGRRLMSIYPTTILQPPFFRNCGGTKFLNLEPAVWSSLDKKLRRVWRKFEEMSIYSQLQSFKPLSVFFFHKLRRHEIFNFWSGSGSLIITKIRRVWRKLKEMIIEHIANYNPSISFLPTLLKARN